MARTPIPIEDINAKIPADSYLKVLSYAVDVYVDKNGRTYTQVLCQCKCGKKKKLVANEVMRGKIKSCGCRGAGRPPRPERMVLTKQPDGTWKDDKGAIWSQGMVVKEPLPKNIFPVTKMAVVDKDGNKKPLSDYMKQRQQSKLGVKK